MAANNAQEVRQKLADTVYDVLQDYTFDLVDEIENRLVQEHLCDEETVKRCADALADQLQRGFSAPFSRFEESLASLFPPPPEEVRPTQTTTTTTPSLEVEAPTDEEAAGRQRAEFAELTKEMGELRRRKREVMKRCKEREKRVASAAETLERLRQLSQRGEMSSATLEALLRGLVESRDQLREAASRLRQTR